METNPRCAQAVFMVLPLTFAYNDQTESTNFFQSQGDLPPDRVQFWAMNEFRTLEMKVGMYGIHVMNYENYDSPILPDAVFSNNWISTHEGGTVFLYPMMAPNRRLESEEGAIKRIQRQYEITNLIDLRAEAEKGKFLEGTGSLVFDRKAEIVYACISERTHPELVERVAKELGYKAVLFEAHDRDGKAVYHTNVMMSIGSEFVIWCKESIRNKKSAELVEQSLKDGGLDLIEISLDQMHNFAANCICLYGDDAYRLIISERAHASLSQDQIDRIEKYAHILASRANVIEEYGGGSVRCMLTDIYLKRIPSNYPQFL